MAIELSTYAALRSYGGAECVCFVKGRDAAGDEGFNDEPFTSSGGGDPYLLWRRLRIEVYPDLSSGSTMQARFYYDGAPLLTADNTSTSTPIPATDLYLGI